MTVTVGDWAGLKGSAISGAVDDVTAAMSDDHKTLDAVNVRYLQGGTGRPIRMLASEVETIEPPMK